MRISRMIGIFLLIAAVVAAAIIGRGYLHKEKAKAEAEPVIETMKQLIPGLGEDTGSSQGDGKDPLPVMTVNDMDIVGLIEAPEIDLTAPVTSEGTEEPGFAEYISGSAVKGKLMIGGSRSDVFSDIAKLKPGDRAAFTDVDGVRYTYSVITQLHLKKWDEADYDLMLCCDTDKDTRFVVGLKRE